MAVLSPPWPANSWSRSGTCSRITRPPHWKPTKASLSNSISLPWCWAHHCAASSDSVTPCPIASAHFEAEPFKLSILHPENERIRTNRSDGELCAPKPRTARRGRPSGGTSSMACLRQALKKQATSTTFFLHDYMPAIRGTPTGGSLLEVTVQPPGGRTMTFYPIVLRHSPARVLW